MTVPFEFQRGEVVASSAGPSLHVVGVDLSMRATGVAVIRPQVGSRRVRLVESSKNPNEDGNDPYPFLYDRLRRIGRLIRTEAFAGRGDGDPTLVVMEAPALFVKAQQHRHTMSWLWGRTYEILSREAAVAVVPPASLKRYVTGSGNADKTAMGHAAAIAFPGVDFTHRGKVNDNLVDAYGLAAMGCRELGFPVEPSVQRVTPSALEPIRWHEPRPSTITTKGLTA